MNTLNIQDVEKYVEDNIGTFHKKRINRIKKLNLNKLLQSKNPYLFKAKYVLTSQEFIKNLTDAFISSGEETMFGDWLEGLAIFINNKVYGGWKSGIKGIDLEFDDNGIRNIISIKSGPNWGNASQIEKLKNIFSNAKRSLRTSNSGLQIRAINGCCYGKDNVPDKGDYFKLCGQRFWEFISGNPNLYTDIIEPLGYKAREKNTEFIQIHSNMINVFTRDFTNQYCDPSGQINWNKLVQYNSKK